MKVVNIDLEVYTEGWSYQANLLPVYQKKLGHDVWLITGLRSYNKDGHSIFVRPQRYISENAIEIIRVKDENLGSKKFIDCYPLMELLEEIKPDVIFFHDLRFYSTWQAVQYKKKYGCVLVMDNHEDIYNHALHNMSLKGKIAFELGRLNSLLYMKYVDHVFGVTEGRVEFAIKQYFAPKERTTFLPMGVDVDSISYKERVDIRKQIFDEIEIPYDTFMILSGGKLDSKKCILELISAYKMIKKNRNVILVLFGSVEEDIKEEFLNQIDDTSIYMYGFLENKKINELFLAADLGFFPGGHSVLWEQAVGCGLPCVFRYRKGMTHVDIGGNCRFIKSGNVATISEELENVLDDLAIYSKMLNVARTKGIKCFSYREIAKESLKYLGE